MVFLVDEPTANPFSGQYGYVAMTMCGFSHDYRFDEAISVYHTALSLDANLTFCADMLTNALDDVLIYEDASNNGVVDRKGVSQHSSMLSVSRGSNVTAMGTGGLESDAFHGTSRVSHLSSNSGEEVSLDTGERNSISIGVTGASIPGEWCREMMAPWSMHSTAHGGLRLGGVDVTTVMEDKKSGGRRQREGSMGSDGGPVDRFGTTVASASEVDGDWAPSLANQSYPQDGPRGPFRGWDGGTPNMSFQEGWNNSNAVATESMEEGVMGIMEGGDEHGIVHGGYNSGLGVSPSATGTPSGDVSPFFQRRSSLSNPTFAHGMMMTTGNGSEGPHISSSISTPGSDRILGRLSPSSTIDRRRQPYEGA